MCAWVHAVSISGASRRRRRQSVAAPPSAPAITPPALIPFRFSLSLSPSFSAYVSFRFFLSLLFGFLPRLFATDYPPSLLLHPKFAKIFEAPFPLLPSVSLFLLVFSDCHIFWRGRIVENFSVNTTQNFYFFSSPDSRRHVPGTFHIVDVAWFRDG